MKHLDIYEQMVASLEGVERKGKKVPYTSLNGNMFSFLDKEGYISIRVDDETRKALFENYGATESIQHGSVMKEYAKLPLGMMGDTKTLKYYIAKSHEHAKSLKPKPTKKKK